MEDKRIKRTKALIKDAFLQCLSAMSLDRVTVKAICHMADINRSTFYAHYSDPLDLHARMESETMEDMARLVAELAHKRLDLPTMLGLLMDYIDRNDKAVYALIRTNSASFKKAQIRLIKEHGLHTPAQAAASCDYAEEYIVSGVLSVIAKWLEGGKKEPVEYMARLLYGLTAGDV
jgi:AcrR family transcriptional regulator